MSKNNDFDVDFEAELEESIAQIIDEETTGAEEYVRTNNLNKSVRKALGYWKKSNQIHEKDRKTQLNDTGGHLNVLQNCSGRYGSRITACN